MGALGRYGQEDRTLVVQYLEELEVNLWDYKGGCITPKRLKGYSTTKEQFEAYTDRELIADCWRKALAWGMEV